MRPNQEPVPSKATLTLECQLDEEVIYSEQCPRCDNWLGKGGFYIVINNVESCDECSGWDE